MLFFTRFSIFAALAATVLIPLGAAAKPELLGSLLVLEEPWQLFNITWASLVLAIFVLVSFRIIQVNAAARFPDYRATLEKEKRAGDTSPRISGAEEAVGSRQKAGGSDRDAVPGWRRVGSQVAARARLAFLAVANVALARLRPGVPAADSIIPRRVATAIGPQSVADFARLQTLAASSAALLDVGRGGRNSHEFR